VYSARSCELVLSRVADPPPGSDLAVADLFYPWEKVSTWVRDYLRASAEHLCLWADVVAPYRFDANAVNNVRMRPYLSLARAGLEAAADARSSEPSVPPTSLRPDSRHRAPSRGPTRPPRRPVTIPDKASRQTSAFACARTPHLAPWPVRTASPRTAFFSALLAAMAHRQTGRTRVPIRWIAARIQDLTNRWRVRSANRLPTHRTTRWSNLSYRRASG